jgi:hypothetical protein
MALVRQVRTGGENGGNDRHHPGHTFTLGRTPAMARAVSILGAGLMLAAAGATKAAVTIADWTFDTSALSGYGTNIGGIKPEGGVNMGTSSASGYHASSSTTWSSPAGNNSQYSFSSDHWAANDYYQFSVSTVGFVQITVAFDQISSDTGPANFHFEYSTDGGASFATFANYTNNHTAFTVSSTTYNENLSAMTGLNNDAGVIFRLADANSISENGGTVGTSGTSGTSKIDNFIVSGIAAVPEPGEAGAVAGVGMLTLCSIRLWRQRQKNAAEV